MKSRRMPRRGDLIAVGVLAGLAVLVFGLPSLLGRPVLPGDDLTQNYPLRVLAGQQIRAGHLPLYDPYIWSGAPLLGGWNAAAAYPLTWLFAVLPRLAGWTVGLVATYAAAAVGMYGFLRLGPGLRPAASFLGGLTFAFGGAMAAQVTHFGVVTGMSWVPLGLLAVHKLTAPSTGAGSAGSAGPPTGPVAQSMGRWRHRLRDWVHDRAAWTALLGLAAGLVILAGEPRAIADGLIVICLYAAWRLVALGRRCLPGLASVTAGVVLGAALSAVQVLPGMAAISTSQRAAGSLALFSSGSLPDRWLALLLVPDLLGGSGTLSQPGFFGFYNLTEVDGYAGILPLVAALVLLARVRVRSPRQLPEWLVWHATALVGVALALGGNTPLGPVLARLPFYGTQRLQSRNILVLDLALAVLLAYWADQPFPAGARRRVILEGVLGSLPAVGVIALVTAGLAGGTGLFTWLDSQAGVSTAVVAALRPWLVPYLVLGAGALGLVVAGRRLPGPLAQRLITALVVVDVIAFSVLAVVQVAPRPPAAAASTAAPASTSAAGTPARAGTPASGHAAPATRAGAVPHLPVRPIADLGYPGRFAIYDPGLLDTSDLSVLQPPDLNSISGTPSVQGYTSIVDGQYAAATGAHQATGDGQDTLAPAAVADGTLDSLDTTILLTLPQYARSDLRTVLVPPHWTLAGYDGAFAIYRNHRAAGPLTLQALPGRTAAGATVSDVTGPAAEPASARVSSVAGARVVRSVADTPGWSALWQPGHGHAVRLAVQRAGVVQAVDVPPGTGTLTWSYTPPRLLEGLALSLAAAVVLLLLWLGAAPRGPLMALRLLLARRRESRPSQPQGSLPQLQPHDSR